MVEMVEQMLELQKQKQTLTNASPHEQTTLNRTINALDKQIDKLTYKLYNLTDDEIALIEKE